MLHPRRVAVVEEEQWCVGLPCVSFVKVLISVMYIIICVLWSSFSLTMWPPPIVCFTIMPCCVCSWACFSSAEIFLTRFCWWSSISTSPHRSSVSLGKSKKYTDCTVVVVFSSRALWDKRTARRRMDCKNKLNGLDVAMSTWKDSSPGLALAYYRQSTIL